LEEFVGNDYPWHIRQPFEQLAKEFLCGPLVASALHQDVQHVALLIHGPPQIVTIALDGEKHLIELPFIAGPRTAASQLIGIWLAKFAAPLADGLLGHPHASLKQQLLHIAEAQAEPKVQPHGMTEDFHRKAIVLIVVGWGCSIRATTLPYCVGVQQVDNV
jgi:hypothetical protein